jgi:DNA-binding winged helix-turn-helix (wHTH) protein
MLSRSDSLADDGRTSEVPGRPLPVAGAEPGQEQSARQPKGEIVVDDYLRIDFDRNEVWAGGKKVSLTPTEYRLLYQLVSQPGRVLSFERLLTSVWGWEYRDEDYYVRLYISYLRQKLEPDPAHPRYILTEKGLGYRFVDYRRHRPAAADAAPSSGAGEAAVPLPSGAAERAAPANAAPEAGAARDASGGGMVAGRGSPAAER